MIKKRSRKGRRRVQCPHCFREVNTKGACPYCGYDASGQAEKYPLALHPGSILNGRYILGHVLGQGGFGITYIAWDDSMKERVAIKEYLPTDFAGRSTGSPSVQVYSGDRAENFEYGKAQFLEEAKTLAAFIGCAGIVRIYSYFEENGTAYLSMEYVDGLPLDKYMAAHGGRLTAEEANRLLLPLMESLETVHEKGVVHRDIAPDNILVTADGLKYDLYDDHVCITGYTKATSQLDIPASIEGKPVTEIGDKALSECDYWRNVTIPDSVTSIGESAFQHCTNLRKVTISDGVTTIGIRAFNLCHLLTDITIPDSVTKIGALAFNSCNLKTIKIPKNITYIENGAFRYCDNLASVTIPVSVASIGNFAFEHSYVKDIYYGGSEEQWNSVKIGGNNETLSTATVHYNSTVE